MTFTEDKSSKALDFSNDNEDRLITRRLDESNEKNDNKRARGRNFKRKSFRISYRYVCILNLLYFIYRLFWVPLIYLWFFFLHNTTYNIKTTYIQKCTVYKYILLAERPGIDRRAKAEHASENSHLHTSLYRKLSGGTINRIQIPQF